MPINDGADAQGAPSQYSSLLREAQLNDERRSLRKYIKRFVAILLAVTMAFAFTSFSFAADMEPKEYSATVVKIGFTTTAYSYKSVSPDIRWYTITEENEYVTCEGMTSGVYQISSPITAEGVKMADRRQIDSGEEDVHYIYRGAGTTPIRDDYTGNFHLRIEKPDSYPSSANMTNKGSLSVTTLLYIWQSKSGRAQGAPQIFL